jgi:sugar O-acyltransferase (sialic acid O-acetyltransferase NeuD family)
VCNNSGRISAEASMKEIFIYGAGGQARVVIDLIEKSGEYRIVGLVDDHAVPGAEVLGYSVLGGEQKLGELLKSGVSLAVVAIGDNLIRRAKAEQLARLGFISSLFVHPFSSVGRESSIGAGSVVFHGAVIDPCVQIGAGVIVNFNAGIGHNSFIGDFAHLSVGVNCGAHVVVGENAFVCMGATIISNVKIGKNALIGAGSVVTKDVPDNTKVLGFPARKLGAGLALD